MKRLLLSLVLGLVAVPWTLTRASSSVNNGNADRVLWKDPGAIASKDLYWGPGAADRAPKPPYTFVRENLSGTKPKLEVTDSAGVTWSVKLALPEPDNNEVHAEIAATRLVWALGYFVDENYFVPEGRIDGVHDLKRAAPVVGAEGSFTAARFERREKGVEARGEWNIEDNPFTGTRELAGLHALLLMLASWDSKPYNTAIVRVAAPGGGEEDRYVLTDLGATFGRMRGGAGKRPNRWMLDEYRDSRLVSSVSRERLTFREPLLGAAPLSIPTPHARWFLTLLAQLTPDQIHRAFEASGATASETDGFSAAVASRIQEIKDKLGR